MLGDWIRTFLNLDDQLRILVGQYGHWVYLGLFGVIFAETGLVVTPFLPGDSLLFAAGALAADGRLRMEVLVPLLILAAVAGDHLNYLVGSRIGRGVLERHPRWIRPEHVARTETFYERHGGRTLILARFLPIIRTFAPFVAGLSRMRYRRFATFSVTGAVLWVGTMSGAGYVFGNLPWVRAHFEVLVVAIVAISLVPAVVEFLKARRR